MRKRDLSAGEMASLAIIQQGYGSQNSVADVCFNEADEAVIFVKKPDGTSVLAANLTNLSAWRADGAIASDKDLRKVWLRLQANVFRLAK